MGGLNVKGAYKGNEPTPSSVEAEERARREIPNRFSLSGQFWIS